MPSDLFNPALLRLLSPTKNSQADRAVSVAAGGQIRWPRVGRFVSGYGQFLLAAVIASPSTSASASTNPTSSESDPEGPPVDGHDSSTIAVMRRYMQSRNGIAK